MAALARVQLLLNHGDSDGAARELHELLERDPNNPDARAMMARIEHNGGMR